MACFSACSVLAGAGALEFSSAALLQEVIKRIKQQSIIMAEFLFIMKQIYNP
jgi:hypothetical protein